MLKRFLKAKWFHINTVCQMVNLGYSYLLIYVTIKRHFHCLK
jgi:hypothetical protein